MRFDPLLGIALALLAGGAEAEDPRVLYLLHCQGCHLADGAGRPGAIPSLVGVARFAAAPEGRRTRLSARGKRPTKSDALWPTPKFPQTAEDRATRLEGGDDPQPRF